MIRLFFGLFILMSSFNVFPGTAIGKITGYLPYSVGTEELIFFKVEGYTGDGCNVTSRFTMKNDNPRFKLTSSSIIAAFMAGTEVKAKGAGTCNNFINSEDLIYLCVGQIPC